MLARRLLLLAAVLMLLTALAAGVAPRQATVDSQPSVQAGAPPLPVGTTVQETITTDKRARTRVKVARGDILQLEVTGDTLDSVLIERLERIEGIAPGKAARFELLMDAPAGAYPIRLVEGDRRIGVIELTD